MEEQTDTTFGQVPKGKHCMAVMGLAGDVKTMWDADNPVEVEEARAQFARLRGKHYLAFRVTGKDGTRGEQMTEFDPSAERIIFSPPLRGG